MVYGTDFGNTRTAGISAAELEGLGQAGLDAAEILAAGTSTPAQLFGLSDLGAIEVGKDASFLVLDADPLVDITAVLRPTAVVNQGAVVAGEL